MLDKLELLLYLARERHFGKAAEAAGVTQPTLSSALKSLEEQLGIVIVDRGSRFHGFTPEGERVLNWARQLTSDARAMHQDIETLRRSYNGELRFGVIPTALPIITDLTVPFRAKCENVKIRVESLTSNAILDKLENLEIDVGISYLDGEPLGRFKGVPLFKERYALLV
ncbi:MAG: LysR family transcriptional regulator, partial [Hyphomicrobiaceae bacterium]